MCSVCLSTSGKQIRTVNCQPHWNGQACPCGVDACGSHWPVSLERDLPLLQAPRADQDGSPPLWNGSKQSAVNRATDTRSSCHRNRTIDSVREVNKCLYRSRMCSNNRTREDEVRLVPHVLGRSRSRQTLLAPHLPAQSCNARKGPSNLLQKCKTACEDHLPRVECNYGWPTQL
jgi:hypothetical protein